MPAVDRAHWPAIAGYVPGDKIPALNRVILQRAWRDLEIAETPPGTNRGVRIEAYLRRAGVSSAEINKGNGLWCAAWLAAVWEDAGAAVPPKGDRAGCDEWGAWAKRRGLWMPARAVPTGGVPEGAAVLYGTPGDLSHIGLVTRWDRWYKRSLEGNTSVGDYSREGVMVAFKDIALQRVQGYVIPPGA